jgi:transposase
LINAARGMVKSLGERLKSCSSEEVGEKLATGLSPAVAQMVQPLLRAIGGLNQQVAAYDQHIREIQKRYPEIELLTAVYGVGELTALTFVLTLEDAQRFRHSRDVGPYLGMRPRQDQSGQRDPELRISKQGDRHLRWLLVECAQCILRHKGADSDLRRWGLAKLKDQGQTQEKQNPQAKKKKNRKKRVVVAVARKLAVLLHHLWATGEVYDPLYQAKITARRSAAA